MNKITSITLLATALLFSLVACVKKDFDEPPYGGDYDPNLPVNMSIADLKDMYNTGFGAEPVILGDDIIISGIITANDKSGNFYKQIIIQDETAAIGINIDQSGLHNEYPIGRKIYVKCNGLALTDYGDFIQIGFGQNGDAIPSPQKDDYIVKATYPNVVEPRIVTVGAVNTVAVNEDLVGMLVKFERVEFASSEAGKTYATYQSSENRLLKSCDESTIELRTSGYSSFYAEPLPSGSGSLTAIYSRFNTSTQLLIRDLSDVQFDQEACPFGSASDSLISISALRDMYQGTDLPLSNRKIRGVVISDPNETTGDNITGRNMVVQQGDRGIVIRFASFEDNVSEVGDSVEIILSGHSLTEYGNLLQVGDQLVAGDVQKLGTGTITPRVASIQQITSNFEEYESTLVTINNANLVSAQNAGVYDGKIEINDGTTQNNFILHTQFYAKFANSSAPIGQTKNITGFIWSTSTEERIAMRTTNDMN